MTLEGRDVPAVGMSLSNGILSITGDSWDNSAYVSLVNNKVHVRVDSVPTDGFVLTPAVKTGSYSGVKEIRFYGNDGDDGFDSTFIYPCYIEGGDGHDELEGGGGADTILGGDGADTLRGAGGNDRLYGGDGVDRLYGEGGHDALFGGGQSSADQLWGGTGRDRFLTQGSDVIKDGSGLNSRTGEDVQLRFADSSSASWSNTEVRKIDDAFQRLFDATGNNRLLRDSMTTEPLTLTQENLTGMWGYNRHPDIRQVREVWYSGPWWNRTEHVSYRSRVFAHRKIVIDEWDAGAAAENREAVATMIHELGHNWDSAEEGNAQWNVFVGHSDWKARGQGGATHYLSGDGEWAYAKSAADGFFGDVIATGRGNSLRYGKWNPREDFATAWEHYFLNGRTTSHTDGIARAKLGTIDRFVRSL
jgi:hypothetical protein